MPWQNTANPRRSICARSKAGLELVRRLSAPGATGPWKPSFAGQMPLLTVGLMSWPRRLIVGLALRLWLLLSFSGGMVYFRRRCKEPLIASRLMSSPACCCPAKPGTARWNVTRLKRKNPPVILITIARSKMGLTSACNIGFFTGTMIGDAALPG